MRDSGLISTAPNCAKSTTGTLGSARDRRRGAAARVSIPLTCAFTSSWVMRPLTPVPLILPRSAPSSRANLRTDGLAYALENAARRCAARARARGAAVSRARPAGAAAAARRWRRPARRVRRGAALQAQALGGGAAGGGRGAAARRRRAASPARPARAAGSASLPTPCRPVLSLTCAIRPAAGAGTSIAAFSVSMVISGVSFSICWPSLTSTSMTLTSLNPPMSGTSTSIGVATSAPRPTRDWVFPDRCRRSAWPRSPSCMSILPSSASALSAAMTT